MWWSSVNEGQVLFLKGRYSSGSSVQNHYDFWELKSCTPQERHHGVWILSRVQFRFNNVAQVCKRSQLGGYHGVAIATGWEFPWDYPQLEYCCARARTFWCLPVTLPRGILWLSPCLLEARPTTIGKGLFEAKVLHGSRFGVFTSRPP